MVSHSLNLFWFADVYPTVSHKNCPKKKKKLGTRVLEESLKNFHIVIEIMLWKFFWTFQKNHAIENHTMENHVRRGLTVFLNEFS